MKPLEITELTDKEFLSLIEYRQSELTKFIDTLLYGEGQMGIKVWVTMYPDERRLRITSQSMIIQNGQWCQLSRGSLLDLSDDFDEYIIKGQDWGSYERIIAVN